MVNSISLQIFKNLFISIAEEMGVTLGRTAYSPNIKERLDYSCAVFDKQGQMIAQAAHIPVHLGSMSSSIEQDIKNQHCFEGDIIILNDPYLGGTHLPDITLVSPIYINNTLEGFIANRGHHADIGGMTPGSLPLSTDVHQEGLIIPPIKLYSQGSLNEDVFQLICRNSRTPGERRGDLSAQIASIRTGEIRMKDVISKYGIHEVIEHMDALMNYSEVLMKKTISDIPNGNYTYTDFMDDDGISSDKIPISVSITVNNDKVTVDFTGTSDQRYGCVNTPYAVARSATLYVFNCLAGQENIPSNEGCSRPISIIIPKDNLLNPSPPHGVAGGNVETSQRIVDVLFGALSKALPDKIPAASQGTMNNLLFGGIHPETKESYVYYETIAGGMGARPTKDGLHAIQTHMTNTLNTPIESMEFQFPIRIKRYSIRKNSGGNGKFTGGDGITKEIEFLGPAQATILSERRNTNPYPLAGGDPGHSGENTLIKNNGEEISLPPKSTFDVSSGDSIRIDTPGGGGWGTE